MAWLKRSNGEPEASGRDQETLTDPPEDSDPYGSADDPALMLPSDPSSLVSEETLGSPLEPSEPPPLVTESATSTDALEARTATDVAGDVPPPLDAMEVARGLWEVKEPTDPSDPVPHEVTDYFTGRGWSVFGASRRGRDHEFRGAYREDSFTLALTHPWLIAAVADGAGSQPLARVGSAIAARSFVSELSAGLSRLTLLKDEEAVRGQLKAIAVEAVISSIAALMKEAARRRTPFQSFASTLVACAYASLAGGDYLVYAQVGDGGVLCRFGDESRFIGRADRGQFAGETDFLTSSTTYSTLDSKVDVWTAPPDLDVISIGSDGVMDDFQTPERQRWLTDQVVQASQAKRPDLDLLDRLKYDLRGSFDDRTLVALVRDRGE